MRDSVIKWEWGVKCKWRECNRLSPLPSPHSIPNPQPDNSEGTKYDIVKLLPRRENIIVSINKANVYVHSVSLKLYELIRWCLTSVNDGILLSFPMFKIIQRQFFKIHKTASNIFTIKWYIIYKSQRIHPHLSLQCSFYTFHDCRRVKEFNFVTTQVFELCSPTCCQHKMCMKPK